MTRSPDRLFCGVRAVATRLARPLCCVAVDAEEDFDWLRPVQATGYSTGCMQGVAQLRDILGAHGIRPTYLLTWPVLDDPAATALVRRQHARGECEMGVQLHPWVTPPFDRPGGDGSYLGSLDPATEQRKLLALMGKFTAAFGFAPRVFRAGRYGLSVATTGLLERHGFAVDTSVAPRTDLRGPAAGSGAGAGAGADSGPDFGGYDCAPFWFGAERRLLELPLCRSVVGWAGGFAPQLYRAATRGAAARRGLARWRGAGVLGRLRCAERVTLSPEGNDPAAVRRLLRHRRAGGQDVFSLSFHSSSLAPGRNPYVRSKADLHGFYDRLSEILAAMADGGFGFAALGEIPALLEAASPAATA